MFIDESFTGVLLSRIERIDFGDLRNKRILEFDGVVKGSMRGKNVACLLKEDICEVSVEVGDRDFLRLVSLGKLC